MPFDNQADELTVQRIRAGDREAWGDLIARYEGRLLAFAERRLRRRDASEDVVQESFIGFLTSLPNYDGQRSLESYLFTICAHKLTDYLRREGRRPPVSLSSPYADRDAVWHVPDSARPVSSVARSGERQGLEEHALANALREQIDHWVRRGEWQKVSCAELLFLRGRGNKDVAEQLGWTEQQVANTKFDFLARLRTNVRRQGLSQEVFPELYGE